MMRRNVLILTVLALTACATSADGDKETTAASGQPSDLAALNVDDISNAPKMGVDDQFISCVEKSANGNTLSQFFLIFGGEVKSYSQMQNRARPMCDAGQPGCALGWQGDEVALYFETASGAVNRMLLDLDTMEMRKRLSNTTRGTEESTAKCATGPLPDGVVIE